MFFAFLERLDRRPNWTDKLKNCAQRKH